MRLLTLAAACALLAAVACKSASSQARDQKLAMHREFAKAYFDKGQYDKAEAQTDLALEIDPKDQSLGLMKAWICLRRGKPQDVLEAEKRFRSLAKGDDYRVQLGLGEALERKGVMYSQSADAVERGERPTPAQDRVARAAQMRTTARDSWNQSQACYRKVLERKQNDIQALNGLQRVSALLGDWNASLGWAEQLLEQSSGEIEFWKQQLARPGITAQEEQRLRELLNASTKLLVETHLQASTLQHQLGKDEDALAHLDQVVALDPDNVQAYSRRALLRHKLGRPKEAKADIEEFLRLSTLSIEDPDMQKALQLLGECDKEIATADEQETH